MREFADPNTINVLGYGVYHTNDMEIDDYNKFGNISILGINYSDNMISVEWMAALFLQSFKKPIEIEIEHFIEVDSKFYSLEELKQSMLFEDDEFIVLDITDLLPIRSFNRSIEMLAERRPSYSYQWMMDIYNYLKSYEDIGILHRRNKT